MILLTVYLLGVIASIFVISIAIKVGDAKRVSYLISILSWIAFIVACANLRSIIEDYKDEINEK